MDRIEASSIINRPVVTDKGRKLGEVADLIFDERTGEIVHIILKNPTENAIKLGLEKTKDGYIVPYSSVKAVGDFLVISEEELV
ncbi:MAG: PRC-barrel domain-containing protein [Nanopusillaceae archaeon]